ncbi:MAG: flagellar motor protein MotB [Bryobacteraceae bacterium]
MDESSSPDHLSSSLTDLMTSLMVIFILLLLVFVQRTGAKDTAEATRLLQELRKELRPGATDSPELKQEQNRILLIAPERLMSFEPGKWALSERGKKFLDQKLPSIARTLYAKEFQTAIESIVVEGHSDLQAFRGYEPAESRNRNLELSQKRAMEVVRTALDDLRISPKEEQDWFVSKLSSSGRGQQDCQAADGQDECRKVIFVIRVRAFDAKSLQAKLQ